MLSQIKNWLRKRVELNEEEHSDDAECILIYKIHSDNTISVDIDIKDFQNETVTKLAYLVSSISSEDSHIEVLKIIMEGFVNAKEGEKFTFLLSEIIRLSEENFNKLAKVADQKSDDEPFIHPSDLL